MITNRIGKLLRSSVPARVEGEVTKRADLARDSARSDAYLRGGSSV